MAPKKTQPKSVDWSNPTHVGVEAWSSGNILLDWISGIGGLPRGRVVETYGPESSGKTSLALQTASHVAATLGTPSWYADMEDAFDPTYANALGLTSAGLKLMDPDEVETLESFLEALHLALEPANFAANPFALVIVDSVAACRCRAEMAGGVDQRTAGLEKARIWSDNLRTLVPKLAKTGATLVLVNQIRDNVDLSGDFVPPGVKAMRPKTRTPGGRAIKFFCSLRLEYDVSSEIKEDRYDVITNANTKQVVGKHIWIKVTKNKVAAPPWRRIRLQIRDGVGFDLAQNLLDFASTHNLLKRDAGVWTFPGSLSADGEPFVIKAVPGFSGDAVAAELLRQRPGIAQELARQVVEILTTSNDYRLDRPPVPDADDETPYIPTLETPK